ncbi:VWA domain-containing protein [bacterium]|nr:VWA domain-containing protein [candidate division CSSED10-310 bacterium]
MVTWGLAGIWRGVWLLSWVLVPLWLFLVRYGHRQRRHQVQRFGEPILMYAALDDGVWKTDADRRRARSGDLHQAMKLIRRMADRRSVVKNALVALALVLSLVALGRPQWGTRQEEVHQAGIDLVLCVDTSESMKAQDVAPSRLDKARSEIATILSELSGHRVGLVGFASTTRLHCPLTMDFRGLRSILDHSLSYGPGTDVEAAVAACVRVLEHSEARSRAVVLISDGEDHEGELPAAVALARQHGIRIFTLGIGTPEGGPIPVEEGDASGYKKKNGEIVWTRMVEDSLRQLAQETGGEYYRATATELEAVRLAEDIGRLEKSEFSQTMTTHREDQFGFFLLLAVLVLALDIVLESYVRIAWEDADEPV